MSSLNLAFISRFTEKLSAAWNNLAERDQKTLLFAAPVILLLILYLLVVQPIYSRYQQARDYQSELSNTLVWLYDNAALVDRLQNVCTRQRLIARDGQDLAGFAKNIGRRSGVTPDIRSVNANDLDVSINNAAGNRALAAVQSFACHGYIVSDLELTRSSETDTQVSLSFKLSASGLLQGS